MRVEDRWVRKDRTRTPEHGKGLRWRAVWTEGGKEHKKSFATKDAATRHVITIQATINDGTHHPTTAGTMTLAAWAEIWFHAQAHQRDGSRETIRRRMDRNIIPTLGHHRLRDLNRANIQHAITVWAETLAPSTIKTTYVYLAGMLKVAVADKHINTMPTAGVRLPKVERSPVRPMSVETVQALPGCHWGAVPGGCGVRCGDGFAAIRTVRHHLGPCGPRGGGCCGGSATGTAHPGRPAAGTAEDGILVPVGEVRHGHDSHAPCRGTGGVGFPEQCRGLLPEHEGYGVAGCPGACARHRGWLAPAPPPSRLAAHCCRPVPSGGRPPAGP